MVYGGAQEQEAGDGGQQVGEAEGGELDHGPGPRRRQLKR
jgi:hypothetical protein